MEGKTTSGGNDFKQVVQLGQHKNFRQAYKEGKLEELPFLLPSSRINSLKMD